MQNKLIDTFSACYRQFLETRMRMRLSPEPFDYLRDHLGYYTKCEKSLINFHAGLTRHGTDFKIREFEQLPEGKHAWHPWVHLPCSKYYNYNAKSESTV